MFSGIDTKSKYLGIGISLLVLIAGITSTYYLHNGHKKGTLQAPKNPVTFSTPSSGAIQLESLSKRVTLSSSPGTYYSIPATNLNGGKTAILDIRKSPIFFFSPWNPPDALKELHTVWNQLKSKPVIVSTGWPQNITTTIAAKKTVDVLDAMGMSDAQVYLLEKNPFGTYVQGLPDTYVWQNGSVYHVPGTLPQATDWLQVFDGTLKVSD